MPKAGARHGPDFGRATFPPAPGSRPGEAAAIPADAAEAMRYSHDVLIPDMDTARRAADQLETLTSSDRWPFPTYSDLLFSV